ncbi:uncharacterized protein LOC116444871 [Corvus moneduloides]|uniref:Uncharacterized protein n=1 Tax=Corvus moneduloides TaxID=1196302 RepID=A0A8C3GSQ1_CORMO|nr:uncharacterized protein LOC116444871 [Corvus moneduloides]XP_031966486.1 uncharacterized protein LOC116444871 [Corvus moneduloides]XP_031966487.1 uncharacterized protein LOC116444871 [Corvus moneduloides]
MPRQRAVPTLTTLCLQSLAQHMQSLWAKDYSDNYLDEYEFRFLVGPFNDLTCGLVQELLGLLGTSRRLSRAALHLLLLPHLQQLSLRPCPALANNALGHLIVLRCQGLSVLDLGGCGRLSPSVLVDLAEGLPRLSRLGLAHTQANVQVLSAVGSCCRHLRELDVSGCKKVTPRALRHLGYDPLARSPGCLTLRVLLARDLEHSEDGDMVAAVAFLLLALPHLEVLAHSALPDALRLLHTRQLDGTKDSEGFPSLKELAQSRGAAPKGHPLTLPLRQLEEVEEDALGIVHAVCPQAEEVSVWLGDSPGPSGLRELPDWECLSRVTLGCAGRHGRALAEVLPLAQGLGTFLRTLTLHGFICRDPLSLPTLLASCPGLQSFSAELEVPPDPHAHAEPPEEPPALPPVWATDLLPHGLHQLQSFSLTLAGPVPAAHRPALSSTLASLLCEAPQLQTLRLLAVPFPLDSVLEPALAGPALRELRELSLAESLVSAGAVWQLLGSDGPLQRLDLSRCPDIHRRDYDAFLQAVRKQRLDLDITWE